MKPFSKFVFLSILIFSLYHLLRDVLQTLEIHNGFTNIFHRSHVWCRSYCNYVTFPLDLLGIIGSWIILKRNKLGTIGVIILLSFPLWLLAAVLP